MRNISFSASRAFSLLLLLAPAVLGWSAIVEAQEEPREIRIPASALSNSNALQEALRVGRELEASQRWNEALNHYEDALDAHPGDRALEERRSFSKAQFHLIRRFADRSYTSELATMSERDAAAVYSEVLDKIQTHYVHEPDWRRLVQNGVRNLEIALTSDVFVRSNMKSVSGDEVDVFRKQLERYIASRIVRSQAEAEHSVTQIARLANHYLRVPMATITLEFACAAASTLDDYSGFLTSGQLNDVFSQIEGNFVGLGIELKAENKSLLIVSVIEGGPAAEGGLQAGDRIIEVDGKSTRDVSTDAAADMLRGNENSSVDLVVTSSDGKNRGLRLVRRRVEVPSVEGIELLDKDYGVAYLRLSSFQKTTSRDLDAALWKLHRQGMRSLIMDLRGNPGGLLPTSVEVADKFVQRGVIVSTRGRSSREDFDYRAHAVGTWRVPLIVLIDGDSASASEIFAGAIRDHRRGVVMGERSYGKGSVQGIFPLNSSKVGVRLTTAKFYSPNGQVISKNGVRPDILVRNVRKPVGATDSGDDDDNDLVVEQAIQYARERWTKR